MLVALKLRAIAIQTAKNGAMAYFHAQNGAGHSNTSRYGSQTRMCKSRETYFLISFPSLKPPGLFESPPWAIACPPPGHSGNGMIVFEYKRVPRVPPLPSGLPTPRRL